MQSEHVAMASGAGRCTDMDEMFLSAASHQSRLVIKDLCMKKNKKKEKKKKLLAVCSTAVQFVKVQFCSAFFSTLRAVLTV